MDSHRVSSLSQKVKRVSTRTAPSMHRPSLSMTVFSVFTGQNSTTMPMMNVI